MTIVFLQAHNNMKKTNGPKKGISRKGATSTAGRSAREAAGTMYSAADLLSQIIDANVSDFADLSSDENEDGCSTY